MKFRDLAIGMHFTFLDLAKDHPAYNTECVKIAPLTFTFQMDPKGYAVKIAEKYFYHTVIETNHFNGELTIKMQARAAISVALV